MIHSNIGTDSAMRRVCRAARSVVSPTGNGKYDGIFVDIGNVVNGPTFISIRWQELYRHLLTEVVGAPGKPRFDQNICFYNVMSERERRAAQELQKATGAAAAASSLQKNDTDIQLMIKVRSFVDRPVTDEMRTPYGHVVLTTGDIDFSELVEHIAARDFVPVVAALSGRISHVLEQKVYECGGVTLHLDDFVVPLHEPEPRTSDKNGMEVFAPAFRKAQMPAQSATAASTLTRTPTVSGDRTPVKPSARTRYEFKMDFFENTPAAPEGKKTETELDTQTDLDSVPDSHDRDEIQNFVVKLVMDKVPSDTTLVGLDRRIMRTVTGLWINGKNPTFSHTTVAIAERTGTDEEDVKESLRQLLDDELLVFREMHYSNNGIPRAAQMLVPTRRGVAASELPPSAIPSSTLNDAIFESHRS